MTRRSTRAVLLGAVLLALTGTSARAGYVPPQDSLVVQRTIEALEADIKAGRATDAVERVANLLNDPSVRFVKTDTQVLPIASWVDRLLVDPAMRTRFSETYERAFGGMAQNQLTSATREGNPTTILAIADRHPWTSAARKARPEAARALLRLGDARGARDLIAQIPTAELDAELRQARDLPLDTELPPAGFSAGWYEQLTPWTMPRSLPVASASTVYIASPLSAAALTKQSRTIWNTGAPVELKSTGTDTKKQPLPPPTDRSLSKPAVWCDLSGTPRVMVARYTTESASTLRAYRPETGELIWDTASNESSRNLLILGNPTIAGRYVYCGAILYEAASGGQMQIVALEITTGNVLWRSEIGDATTITDGQHRRASSRSGEAETIAEQVMQSSAIVSADERNVYGLFRGGWLVAVDRFTGALRWVSSYPAWEPTWKELERNRKSETPPTYRRWRDWAVSDGNGTVIVAPTDSHHAIAFDAVTGAQKWAVDSAKGFDLVGFADGKALLCGPSLMALRVDSGEPAWQNAIEGARIVGPAFLEGNTMGVMTDRGVGFFNISDGLPVAKRESERLIVDQILKQPMSRAMLATAKLLPYFASFDETPPPPPPSRKEKRR